MAIKAGDTTYFLIMSLQISLLLYALPYVLFLLDSFDARPTGL